MGTAVALPPLLFPHGTASVVPENDKEPSSGMACMVFFFQNRCCGTFCIDRQGLLSFVLTFRTFTYRTFTLSTDGTMSMSSHLLLCFCNDCTCLYRSALVG